MLAASTTPFARSAYATGIIPATLAVLERFPTSLLGLAFRVAVATVFFRSGLAKIASWDATVALFDMEYMLPFIPAELGAYMAATLELTAPVLLVLGFLTRPAAAALLGMTAVIQLFVYPESWPDHILWASILLYLVMRGAGTLSVDHLIARWFSRHAA